MNFIMFIWQKFCGKGFNTEEDVWFYYGIPIWRRGPNHDGQLKN